MESVDEEEEELGAGTEVDVEVDALTGEGAGVGKLDATTAVAGVAGVKKSVLNGCFRSKSSQHGAENKTKVGPEILCKTGSFQPPRCDPVSSRQSTVPRLQIVH